MSSLPTGRNVDDILKAAFTEVLSDFSLKGVTTLPAEIDIKNKYLQMAISQYEYSPAPEYEKRRMSIKAATKGTIDFDYHDAESDVEVAPDGAWVRARVWVPKDWLAAD